GYEQALASYKARKASGTPNIQVASAGSGSKKSTTLLAALFGGGADEAEDDADVVASAAPKAPAPKAKVAKAAPAAPAKSNLPGIAIISPDKAQRADIPMIEDAADEAPAAEALTPETIIAALPARQVPVPAFAPRPKADVGVVAVAEVQVPQTPETPETVPFGIADASDAVQPVAVQMA